MMAVAHTLLRYGAGDRDLYLFDTYEGMVAPTAVDVKANGLVASEKFQRTKTGHNRSSWNYASLDEVQTNLYGTLYCQERISFIKGRVEDTVPKFAPNQIAILRLDTDFYESTKHELEHLYPRLARGGVIIINTYRRWRGCKQAVDEYFSRNQISILLSRIDTGGIGIKT
jgi:hypothetical protein